jgi:hypothetical protein
VLIVMWSADSSPRPLTNMDMKVPRIVAPEARDDARGEAPPVDPAHDPGVDPALPETT